MIFAKLYLEHISEKQLVSTLTETPEIKYWAFILHDQDKFPDGELKKAHFHVIIDYLDDSKRGAKNFMNKIFTETMLSGADIQTARNSTKVHRYLMHLDNLEKHQYAPEDIKTSDPQLLEDLLVQPIRSDKANDYFMQIFNFIKETEVDNGEYVTYGDIVQFCMQKGFINYYVKNQDNINFTLNQVYDLALPTYKRRH